jgi:hypothetical protein
VVQAINHSGINWSRYGTVIEDIQDTLRGIPVLDRKTCHSKRQGTRAAHTLAQVGVQQVLSRCWFDCNPEFIHTVVASENPSLIL